MQTALEGSPSGDAEPPRELALCGVQRTTANPKKRNTKRGKRNIRKITERKYTKNEKDKNTKNIPKKTGEGQQNNKTK